jgi:hypothetical protein
LHFACEKQTLIFYLQRFGRDIPQPTSYVVTRWASDPFSYGTYSYIAVGSSGDDYDTLAKTVDNKLFFAGEATIREHPATAAGMFCLFVCFL